MTSRRRAVFKCNKCGRLIVQPLDSDHPEHEIRSWCCGVSLERCYDGSHGEKVREGE